MPECPECAQGKHINCTVDVIDLDTDAMERCACYARSHREEEKVSE